LVLDINVLFVGKKSILPCTIMIHTNKKTPGISTVARAVDSAPGKMFEEVAGGRRTPGD
jgi:hypothetical protein